MKLALGDRNHGSGADPAMREFLRTELKLARYRDRMVQVQDLQYDLSDAITQRSSREIVEASEKIKALLQEDLDYWIKQKIDDAIGYGKSSVNYSSALAEDAKKQDFAAAMATYKKLQSTCRSCHDAHPEKRAKSKLDQSYLFDLRTSDIG